MMSALLFMISAHTLSTLATLATIFMILPISALLVSSDHLHNLIVYSQRLTTACSAIYLSAAGSSAQLIKTAVSLVTDSTQSNGYSLISSPNMV